MPKILYLITELDIGGAEKNLFRLATTLARRGWGVEVAALSGRGKVGEWLDREGVRVHYIGMDLKSNPFAFARLARTIRRGRPDILHTFLFHANVAGRLANIFARVPIVVSSIRVAERRRPSHLRLDFLTHFLMDVEVCVSEGVREFTGKYARIPLGKLAVIPNAVETPRPDRPRDVVRAELGARADDMVVLSVGRLDVQKGYVYLVDAAEQLLKSHGNLIFVVAGEGGERPRIEAAILRAGIGARFRLLGWRADTADLYGAADIFVLPSLWEGMPNALLEAAAAGLPVVATAVEGSTEILDNGRTGLLVAPRDPQALASAIETLARDANLRERIAQSGKPAVLKSHSVEDFVASHESLYRELLSRKSSVG